MHGEGGVVSALLIGLKNETIQIQILPYNQISLLMVSVFEYLLNKRRETNAKGERAIATIVQKIEPM